MRGLRFALSLGEQGFGSLLTFALNLWLIRNGAVSAYGTYVFWMGVAFVMGVAQGTLVLAHLSRLPSARTHMAERRDPERFMLSVSVILLVLITAAVAIGEGLLAQAGSVLATPAAILFTPAFLLFQFARTLAFSRQRPGIALALTGGILAVAALALALDFAAGHPPSAGRVLLLTGLAYGGVSALVVVRLMAGMAPMWRPAELWAHRGQSRGFAWLMLGAGSNEVTSRLYSFVIVGRIGTEALAVMSAVQVVIRPAWLLSSAWSSIGFPEMGARWAARDRGGVVRTMLLGGAVTALGSAVWSAIVVEAWPWISGALYHGRYTEIGPLAYLWGANVVLGSVCMALNMGMLAVGEFRRLALVDLAGAVVTVGALIPTVMLFAYPWAIAATIMGQAMQLVLMAAILRGRLRPEAEPAGVAAQLG